MRKMQGFTIVEILIVVAIIVLLISVLVPAIIGALDNAENVRCQSNLSAIGKGFLAYASDNNTTFPGCKDAPGDPTAPDQASWLGNEVWAGDDRPGTLLSYIGGITTAQDLYRCPTLEAELNNHDDGFSNGMFDYASTLAFAGAKVESVEYNAEVYAIDDIAQVGTGPATTSPWVRNANVTPIGKISTPLVLEERAGANQNVNGSISPAFKTNDQFAWNHNTTRGNFVTPDGSTSQIEHSSEFKDGVTAQQVFVRGPRTKKLISLSSVPADAAVTPGYYYGMWEKRAE